MDGGTGAGQDDRATRGAPSRASWVDRDRAVVRLEDVLDELPLDRAVPDLGDVLERAGVDLDLLRQDERALKLLREALLARPFGSLDAVAQVRTEVELLTLEVEVLTERLRDPDATDEVVAGAADRLRRVRERLGELHDQL